jgi:hypothetical protein
MYFKSKQDNHDFVTEQIFIKKRGNDTFKKYHRLLGKLFRYSLLNVLSYITHTPF